MTTQAPERVPETVKPQRGRMLWTIILIVAVIIAAGVGVWFLMGDEGTPTVTFDGEAATYDGPTTFEAGAVTFTFDASGYEPGVAFVVGAISDDTVTFDDLEAWAGAGPGTGSTPPEFLSGYDIALAVEGDRIVEKELTLNAATRYGVFANTAPDDTDRSYPAAILVVE